MRMVVADQLIRLVPEKYSRIHSLLWVASTSPDEEGRRAYRMAVNAMLRRRLADRDQVAKIARAVRAEIKRLKQASQQ